jgi:hypothetical protein
MVVFIVCTACHVPIHRTIVVITDVSNFDRCCPTRIMPYADGVSGK